MLVVEQSNELPFNRGAMKNIGAIWTQRLYKNTPVTLVFNDIDCYALNPAKHEFTVNRGEVKHIYGYRASLGGIFAVRLEDFLQSRGFPNYWG